MRLWSKQAEIARAVAEVDHVAAKSGHKIGKSNLDSTLALWWVTTRPGARAIFTAPASHQVGHILWPELRLLYSQARLPLGGKLYKTHDRGLVFREQWEVFGLTTDKPERFAGISSRRGILFIVDEASGFPEDIYEAVFGNTAGGAKVLLTGNPTRTSGTFYDAFHTKRTSWRTFTISSLDTPNFHGGNIPGLATPAWAEWAKTHWGNGKMEGPIIDVRVLGNFPRQATNAVIPLYLVEEALERWKAFPKEERDGKQEEGALEFGVDVARFGDDESVIAPRRGRLGLPLEAYQGTDLTELAGLVLQAVRLYRRPEEDPDDLHFTGAPKVKIDEVGLGAGLVDILKSSKEVEAIGVNVAQSADDEEKFHSLRSQIAFALKDWLAAEAILPEDPKLETELVAPLYSFDARGRYQVEEKEKLKDAKRLGRSPDRFDARALSVYSPPPAAYSSARGGAGRWNRGR